MRTRCLNKTKGLTEELQAFIDRGDIKRHDYLHSFSFIRELLDNASGPPNDQDEPQAKMAPALLFSLQGRCDFGLSAPSIG